MTFSFQKSNNIESPQKLKSNTVVVEESQAVAIQNRSVGNGGDISCIQNDQYTQRNNLDFTPFGPSRSIDGIVEKCLV